MDHREKGREGVCSGKGKRKNQINRKKKKKGKKGFVFFTLSVLSGGKYGGGKMAGEC